MPEGNGAGAGDGQGAAGDVQQQLTNITAKLAVVEGELKISKDAKVDLEQRLDAADAELLSDGYLVYKDGKAKGAAGGGAADAGDGSGLDVERASNREIVDFVQKQYKGDMAAAVKDIKGQLDLNKQQIGIISAQFDVALTSLKHNGVDGKPSFEENQKEIFEIAKANPTWRAEKCYQQFVLQAKVKADEDAATAKKKAEDEDRAATEKVGVPGSTVQQKELSAEEAANVGYRKAFGTEK